MPAKILICRELLIAQLSSALNDRPKHGVLLDGNRALFSQSCPSSECTACRRDPTKNNARSYITVYNTCLVSMTVESHSERRWLAHATACNDVKSARGVNIHVEPRGRSCSWFHGAERFLLSDFVLLSFNVYIQTVGTNRACGSFTMQGICGWPIHSASWLFLNMLCQTQCGLGKWICTTQLAFDLAVDL